MTKKEILKFILIILGAFAVIGGIVWLIIELAPYLLAIVAFPVWLAAALADGAKVK